MRVGYAARVLNEKVADAFSSYAKIKDSNPTLLDCNATLRMRQKAFEAFNTRFPVRDNSQTCWAGRVAALADAYRYFTAWDKR